MAWRRRISGTKECGGTRERSELDPFLNERVSIKSIIRGRAGCESVPVNYLRLHFATLRALMVGPVRPGPARPDLVVCSERERADGK